MLHFSFMAGETKNDPEYARQVIAEPLDRATTSISRSSFVLTFQLVESSNISGFLFSNSAIGLVLHCMFVQFMLMMPLVLLTEPTRQQLASRNSSKGLVLRDIF